MTREALEILTETDLILIRKSIYGARATVRPTFAKTLLELHTALQGMNIRTKLQENFVMANDEVENNAMFSTEKNLDFFQTCDHIPMDGTFYACPTLFAQLFIVHGKKSNVNVLLAYFLLPGKSAHCYTKWLSGN